MKGFQVEGVGRNSNRFFTWWTLNDDQLFRERCTKCCKLRLVQFEIITRRPFVVAQHFYNGDFRIRVGLWQTIREHIRRLFVQIRWRRNHFIHLNNVFLQWKIVFAEFLQHLQIMSIGLRTIYMGIYSVSAFFFSTNTKKRHTSKYTCDSTMT